MRLQGAPTFSDYLVFGPPTDRPRATFFQMDDKQPRQHPKLIKFEPTPPLARAFFAYMSGEGHASERKAAEALIREGLQRRDLLPGPKDQKQKP